MLVLAGWSGTALALPTPDVVMGVMSLAPAILSGLAAMIVAVAFRLRGRFGSRAVDLSAGALLGGIIVAAALIWTGTAARDADSQEINELAVFLRCDFTAHANARQNWLGPEVGLAAWRPYGAFQRISMADAQRRLQEDASDASLFVTYRMEIEYHSGVPGVLLDGQVQPFGYSRRSELSAALAAVAGGDLYLADFAPIKRRPQSYPRLLEAFRQFRNVFVIDRVPAADRYVWRDERWYPADPRPLIDWPVGERTSVLDEAQVTFPGMVNLLDDSSAAALLMDPYVYLVAPNDSYLRSADTYYDYYLPTMIEDVPSMSAFLPAGDTRLLAVDTNSASVSRRLDAVAKRIDGKPFMLVGTTRYDFTDQGIDVAFGLWNRLGRDPQRFQFHGYTARLPEVVARVWMDQGKRRLADIVRAAFVGGITRIQMGLGVSTAIAILLFGAFLRLLISPLGLLETRSRRLRAALDSGHPAFERFPAAGKLLGGRLGVATWRELPGTLATLVLVVPAFDALTSSPGLDGSFLWVGSITHADPGISVIVGLLFAAKLLSLLGTGRVHLLLAGAVVVALLWVPTTVLLYVLGSLIVTLAQDATAAQAANRGIERALLSPVRP